MNVKTSNYYGTYMQVLQEMVKKLVAIMETICGITRNVKKTQRIPWDPYAGIATNEECQQLFAAHMRVLQGMQNASGYYGTCMQVLQ